MLYLFSLLLILVFSLRSTPTSASPTPLHKRYTGVKIQSVRDNTCLGLAVRAAQNGVQVTKVGCVDAPNWDINPGSGSIILSGTNYALDAGTGRDNNEIVKARLVPPYIWHSYPTVFQQTWYYTDDKRIAITGGEQCLDEGDNGPQTYQCTTGNTNQIWNIFTASEPSSSSSSPSSTSSVSPSSTSSTAPTGLPTGIVFSDPPNGGHRIRPYGRDDLCVTVSSADPSAGASVNIAYCHANDDNYAGLQLWNTTSTSYGQIPLFQHPQYCLSGSMQPANGARITIEPCGTGTNVLWDFGAGKLVLTHSPWCLDVQAKPDRQIPLRDPTRSRRGSRFGSVSTETYSSNSTFLEIEPSLRIIKSRVDTVRFEVESL